MRLLAAVCVVFFGLMAGFFFAFSAVVMPGLNLMPADSGMLAMQQINIAVINPWFAIGFWGALVAAVLGALGAILSRGTGWPWLLSGSVVYLLAGLALTAWGNVPLNRALAVIDPTSAEGLTIWGQYQQRWTMLNHLRTLGCLVATALTLGALQRARRFR